jgi:hypothetical protein
MMIKYKLPTAFALTALFSAGAMAAGNTIEDKHSFRLGVYSQDADITSQSTVDPLPPIEIDLIRDLDLDDSSESIFFNYRWRFKEKWSLSATFQRLELEGNGVAGFDFTYDGEPFVAGMVTDTQFDMDTYLIDVAYSIVRNDKWEVSVGGGIHAFDFDTTINGTLFLEGGGEETVLQSTSSSADVLAPLPNLRAAATYLISPRWEVTTGVGWLSLEIDNVDGKYTYFELGTEYRFTDRFGVGATYQVSKIEVTSTESDKLEKFDVEFSGPSIYLSYGF